MTELFYILNLGSISINVILRASKLLKMSCVWVRIFFLPIVYNGEKMAKDIYLSYILVMYPI